MWNWRNSYPELSSNKKELLTALLESSVISTLMLEMTWREIMGEVIDHSNPVDKVYKSKNTIIKKFRYKNLHQVTRSEYYNCHPNIVYIFYIVAEHSRSEQSKHWCERIAWNKEQNKLPKHKYKTERWGMQRNKNTAWIKIKIGLGAQIKFLKTAVPNHASRYTCVHAQRDLQGTDHLWFHRRIFCTSDVWPANQNY